MIIDGAVDQYPEAAFMLVGTIEDAIEKGEEAACREQVMPKHVRRED